MKEFGYNKKIQVCGVTFGNVHDMIHCAVKHVAKKGIYVGVDSERYPCFDSVDYDTEDRRYWNFVFATSEEELAGKLEKLKTAPIVGGNYRKMNSKLYPMAYWGGDTYHKVEVVAEGEEESKPFP